MSAEQVLRRVVRILLDIGCIAMGLYGIWFQTAKVPPGQASEPLLVAYVAILGIPAGAGFASLLSNGSTATTSPGSPEAAQPSPSQPSSSPSATPGGSP